MQTTTAMLAPETARRSRYLEELARRVLVYDGAMGTNIQLRELSAADFGGQEGCNEYLVLTRPAVVEDIHASFLQVGCDVVETDTFGGSRPKLDEYGLGGRTHEINCTAAQLARRVADRHSTPERPRFVAGSMGPTGLLPSSDDPVLGNVTFEQLAEVFAEQARGLVEGGCDLLLVETGQDILEVKAAVAGINRYFRASGRWVPIQAQVTLDTSGRMLLGTDVSAVVAILEALPVQVIGLNCSTGPEHMREPVRYLCERSRLPISVIPNAGLPLNAGGRAVYPLEPEPMARALAEFVEEFGVSVVGGCCGTTPDHLKRIVDLVGGKAPKRREVRREPAIASAVRAVALRQVPPPLLVGERLNAQGSRKVKRLLLASDYDGLLEVAREQADGGAHALDVCVALTERSDEAEQMRRAVKRLSMGSELPLVVDATEYAVITEALRTYPGRAIVNSINMENGRERIERILPHVKEHGAAVVALTIDEAGMARTADRKVEVARKIHRIATDEYGLAAEDLIFDALTFTLATGQAEFLSSAVETLEGVRRIKAELPGVLAILGVSNVSFGLSTSARGVLNSVFLHHAVRAGLDLAIVNPAHITPYAEVPVEQRELAEDLIANRRPDALARYISYFEEHQVAQPGGAQPADPTEGMAVEERIHWQILHRKKDGIEGLLDQALATRTPVEVLNEILLPAMKDVGDKFGAGELILPFVLQSAEVMKRAVAHLEQFLEKKAGYTKGRVVLATVFGDVHDIGKNLVSTILANNGYTVCDLGKQVPINTVIDKAVEVEATAIGLSALLVSTSKQMPLCVQELDRRGLKFPVLIGGAAINPAFGRRALFVGEDRAYEPGVFYCKDAFEGLAAMDRLTDPEQRDAFVARVREAARRELAREAERAAAAAPAAPAGRRSKVGADAPIPRPPFWGDRVLDPIDLAEVFELLDLNTLFRLHWGGKSYHGEQYQELVAGEFLPRLAEWKAETIDKGYLQPRAVYGYFPGRSQGNELIVGDPTHPARELLRFGFPRQPGGEYLCLADYFAAVDSGRLDVVPFFLVTVGSRASQVCEEWQQAGEYSRGYYLQGLAFQTAEAAAEWIHRRIRRELGLPADQGRRYAWGYPACPDLADHVKLFQLLPIRQSIGVELTDYYQFVPEQSTAGLVVHHPEARYYSTMERRTTNDERRTTNDGGR